MRYMIRYQEFILTNHGQTIVSQQVKGSGYEIDQHNYIVREVKQDFIFADAISVVDTMEKIKISELISRKINLSELIGCVVNFHSYSIDLSEYGIRFLLQMMGFQFHLVRYWKNSINGYADKGNRKFFYKILDLKHHEQELSGYATVRFKFPCSVLVGVDYFINYVISFYEFDKSTGANRGLLQDLLAQYDEYSHLPEHVLVQLDTVISAYTRNYSDQIPRKSYPLDLFFRDRLKSRIVLWYENCEWMDYTVYVNGENSITTRHILQESINYFETGPELSCVISHGDPNMLNLGLKPVFFDFYVSGYNPAIADLTIFFLSVLLFDRFLAPKYHKRTFMEHDFILQQKNDLDTVCLSHTNPLLKTIKLDVRLILSPVRHELLNKLLDKIESFELKLDDTARFFVAVRIMSVFNLNEMEVPDRMYCLALLHLFYSSFFENNGVEFFRSILKLYADERAKIDLIEKGEAYVR
ncbi:hypothetical protein [Clostridium sp. E02]|uniref:hypothetical protein n=1 Tax=Clostridium sp. E02 TaxID=2487134 RepID=UPI000F520A11|nr:hypothetical protein [Clostridium sp. E02]